MSIHQLSRQQSKREAKNVAELQRNEAEEDLTEARLSAEAMSESEVEEDRRQMIIGGYDPYTLQKYGTLSEYHFALQGVEFLDLEEQQTICAVSARLRSHDLKRRITA